MDRNFYLEMAASGAAFPIGTDLVVHEQPNPEQVIRDGVLLGKAVEEAARRYHAPLAFPLMDLTLEKALLLDILGVSAGDAATYHFSECPDDEALELVRRELPGRSSPRIEAACESISYVATNTDLLPVGMCIGPFSLMTKLMADPITAVYLLGMGMPAEEDEAVATVQKSLELAGLVIQEYITRQVASGAKAIVMCEPAANNVYISPNQIADGSNVFERCVMAPGFEITKLLDRHRVDLIFHDCGELNDHMVEQFARLAPVILSLGSSRRLWEDARLIPKNIVLYGNLPSKHFYSDEKISKADVIAQSRELIRKMQEAGHPFILGSECDVLSVPEAEATIREKANAIAACGCLCQHHRSHPGRNEMQQSA